MSGKFCLPFVGFLSVSDALLPLESIKGLERLPFSSFIFASQSLNVWLVATSFSCAMAIFPHFSLQGLNFSLSLLKLLSNESHLELLWGGSSIDRIIDNICETLVFFKELVDLLNEVSNWILRLLTLLDIILMNTTSQDILKSRASASSIEIKAGIILILEDVSF